MNVELKTRSGDVAMPIQGPNLKLDRCPHCMVASPHLKKEWAIQGRTPGDTQAYTWVVYICQSCFRLVLTNAFSGAGEPPVIDVYPKVDEVDRAIPERAREFLQQAIASLHSPAGAVMLAASSVDSMLKAKGLTGGVLNARINKAADIHLITKEMAEWAHEIRLDANDQRHADESAPLPSLADAKKCIEFTQALGQFLFVLPDRVTRGRDAGKV